MPECQSVLATADVEAKAKGNELPEELIMRLRPPIGYNKRIFVAFWGLLPVRPGSNAKCRDFQPAEKDSPPRIQTSLASTDLSSATPATGACYPLTIF